MFPLNMEGTEVFQLTRSHLCHSKSVLPCDRIPRIIQWKLTSVNRMIVPVVALF